MSIIVFFWFLFTFLLVKYPEIEYSEEISKELYDEWAKNDAQCTYGGVAKNITLKSNGTYELVCYTEKLGWKGYVTVFVLFLVTIGLYLNYPHDVVTLAGTCVLIFLQIVNVNDAFSALSNPSILSIGVLFIVARAVDKVYLYYYFRVVLLLF